MFDRRAHSSLAFYYGCWEQGLQRCYGTKECGADQSKGAFSRLITVPQVLPDGDYVLSMLWYGGVEYRRRKGKFSDFTSCSFVRIQGGLRKKYRFRPFFEVGNTGEFQNGDKCLTSATYPGQCTRGCDWRNAFYAKPYPFGLGAKPRYLRLGDFDDA